MENLEISKLVLIIVIALFHGGVIVVSIYVAINTRITRLEVKVDLMWNNVKQVLRQNGIDMRDD